MKGFPMNSTSRILLLAVTIWYNAVFGKNREVLVSVKVEVRMISGDRDKQRIK